MCPRADTAESQNLRFAFSKPAIQRSTQSGKTQCASSARQFAVQRLQSAPQETLGAACLPRRDCGLESSRFEKIPPGQLIPRQPFTDNLPHHYIKAVAVVHLAVIVTKCLLIKVAEQVDGFDADVGSA